MSEQARPPSGSRNSRSALHGARTAAVCVVDAPDRAGGVQSAAKPRPTDRNRRSCAMRPVGSHVIVPSACHCLSGAPRPELPWVRWRLRGLDSRGLSGLVLTIVQSLIFSWWDIFNGAVQAPVVPPVHPLGSG